jgi:hypothetical protein
MNQTHTDASNTSDDGLLPKDLSQLRQAVADSFAAGARSPDGGPGRARPHQVGDWQQQQQQLLQHTTITQNSLHTVYISCQLAKTLTKCSSSFIASL